MASLIVLSFRSRTYSGAMRCRIPSASSRRSSGSRSPGPIVAQLAFSGSRMNSLSKYSAATLSSGDCAAPKVAYG